MTWRAAWFARWNPAMVRVLRALEALHQGAWLGLMDGPALDEATARWYARSGRHADHAHARGGLFAWEAAALDAWFSDRRRVIVAAAGGGREVVPLVRRGHAVEAFDCAPDVVEACREFLAAEGVSASVHLAPPGAVPGGLGTFDAAIVGWGAYMHVPGRDRRIRFLRSLAAHLQPGAPVLLSYFTLERDTPMLRATASVAAFVRRVRGSREPVEVGDSLPGTFDHLFTRAEVAAELSEAGLEPVAIGTDPYGHAVAKVPAAGPDPAPV
jgi:2-polyprenyl-3-methyl-5-hydroxy-6-metoxy-1,4-benzoquinol methylase